MVDAVVGVDVVRVAWPGDARVALALPRLLVADLAVLADRRVVVNVAVDVTVVLLDAILSWISFKITFP